MTERWQDIVDRAVALPALLVVAVLALLAAGLLAFVAVQSGGDEGPQLAGRWTVGLTTQRGPEAERVGQSIGCTASLSETDTVLAGEMDCDLLGTSHDVSGFVFPQSNDVRLVASFSETTVEVLAESVSPNQMIGSWEDSQGFAGRFVAIKDQLASD